MRRLGTTILRRRAARTRLGPIYGRGQHVPHLGLDDQSASSLQNTKNSTPLVINEAIQIVSYGIAANYDLFHGTHYMFGGWRWRGN